MMSGRAVGVWRSLVAHTLGVRVVAGSNPATPTNQNSSKSKNFRSFSSRAAWLNPSTVPKFVPHHAQNPRCAARRGSTRTSISIWSKDLLETGKKRLEGDTAGATVGLEQAARGG
jgi:hypothetical protein